MINQKLICVFALLLGSLSLSAQNEFSVTPNLHEEDLVNVDPASIDSHKFASLMANLTNDTLPIRWKVIALNRPDTWFVSISDINQGVIISPSFLNNGGALELDLLPNVDNVIFDLHFHPKETSGCGEAWVEISNYETQVVYDTIRYDLLLNNCDNTVSTDELSNDNIEVNVFPNPVTEFLTIEGATYPLDVTLFNSFGEMVYQAKLMSKDQIDVATLPSGVYFLRVDDDRAEKGISKIIKL